MTTAAAALVLAGPAGAADRIAYVGDSLGVGTTPQLQRVLGAQASIAGDSRIGRPSPEGLPVLRQLLAPGDNIVVFDLGTNDDPAQPARLAVDLAAARQLAGNRCLVVATLNRPPLNGVTVDGLNRAVQSFAAQSPTVQLVDWHGYVRAQPSLLGGDRIHPTPQGYAVRAQLFAQAIASCGSTVSVPQPRARPRSVAPARRARRPRPAPPVKVPGIEASGISFTEPLTIAGLHGELILPATKPPYPAVVMVPGAPRSLAGWFAEHGIAALVYDRRAHSGLDQQAADARAAVAAVRSRAGVRPQGLALWGAGESAHVAALAAGGNTAVTAVVAVSPGLARGTNASWAVRRALGGSGTTPVAHWYELSSGSGDGARDPALAWSHVFQPVLAVWDASRPSVPAHAAAARLRRALERSGNRDRTFRSYSTGDGRSAQLAWLAGHLGNSRAGSVIDTAPVAALDVPAVSDVAARSVLFTPAAQLAWLAVVLALFVVAARRSPGRRLTVLAAAFSLAALAALGGGIAVAVRNHGRGVAHIAGIPLLFAIAAVLTAAGLVAAGLLARRRQGLAAAASLLAVILALAWLL